MAHPVDTIAALATPSGTSALACVRASGSLVPGLAAAIFNESPLPRRARHADYRAQNGTFVDEVVYVYFKEPDSYTGEDVLEITCHGNPFIIRKILDDLHDRGCRPAEPGEFTRQAFLNGRMDLSQAEAVVDLISARSDRALAAAHRQLRGALGRRMQELIDPLLSMLAEVEAYIDFPEEDLPPHDRATLRIGIQNLLNAVARLLATTHYGEILRDGLKTVILGEPNAGKSSLLNRLVGYERALVSAEPGTTRDYLEERIILGAHCIRLTDTAGLNALPGPLEKLGIDKALERAAEADLILLVIDATRPAPSLAPELSIHLRSPNALLVVNKIDLVAGGPYPEPQGHLPAVKVSALTGVGCDELVAAIVRHAESFRTDQNEDLITLNARHANALGHASECLSAALEKVEIGDAFELVASDFRGAMDAFSQILGKISNEKVLDRLFSTFCIGK